MLRIRRIATRLALILALAAVVPLVGFGIVSLLSLQEGTRSSVMAGNRNVAERAADEIRRYVSGHANILTALAATLQDTGLEAWQQDRILKDYVLQFRVEAGRGTLVGRSPSLYGPVLVSGPNGEIFSCEGNGATQGEGAIIFDRNGRVQAHVEHVGALKACGISANRRLYWLQYVLAERGHTYSLVRIIGAGGLVHGERRLDEAGTAHFRDDDGQAYTFEIGPPTLPAGYASVR